MNGYQGIYDSFRHKPNEQFSLDKTFKVKVPEFCVLWFNSELLLLQVSEKEEKPKYHPILTWKKTVSRIPWGVIVLLGGGFALATATTVSNSLGMFKPFFFF